MGLGNRTLSKRKQERGCKIVCYLGAKMHIGVGNMTMCNGNLYNPDEITF